MTNDSLEVKTSKPVASNQAASQSEQTGAHPSQASATFSIATSVVTQYGENLSDTSFLQPANTYQPEVSIKVEEQPDKDLARSTCSSSQAMDKIPVECNNSKHDEASLPEPTATVNIHAALACSEQAQVIDQNQSQIDEHKKSEAPSSQEDRSKITTTPASSAKKKAKTNKKNVKLDTKSKLEKSRQSARECRARKKLRYQYLEDLVCNREKAVVKLREELSMFCKMSEQLDSGIISETDRHFLVEQTKENSKS